MPDCLQNDEHERTSTVCYLQSKCFVISKRQRVVWLAGWSLETTNPLELYMILYIHVHFYRKRHRKLWLGSQKGRLTPPRKPHCVKKLSGGHRNIVLRSQMKDAILAFCGNQNYPNGPTRVTLFVDTEKFSKFQYIIPFLNGNYYSQSHICQKM